MRMHDFRKLFPLVLAVASLGYVAGCGYPKVSERSYDIAQALYSICNREQSDKLDAVAVLIESSATEGAISSDESRWLTAVVDQARAGEWESAAIETRQILEDQVEW